MAINKQDDTAQFFNIQSRISWEEKSQMLTTEGTAFHQVITQHLSMLAAVTSPDLNEDWSLHGQTGEERKDAQENYTSKEHSEFYFHPRPKTQMFHTQTHLREDH